MDVTVPTSEEQHARSVVDMMDTDRTVSRRIRETPCTQSIQASSEDSTLPITVVETTPRTAKIASEVPHIVPRKRNIDDGISLHEEKMLPPKRQRKINKIDPSQETGALNYELPANELETTGSLAALAHLNEGSVVTSNTKTERVGNPQNEQELCPQTDAPHTPVSASSVLASTKLQSSFALQNPVTTGLMHSHLASLLDQCRETLGRASQHQRHQEEQTRHLHLNDREEVAKLRWKLDQTTSMLFQEHEALARTRDELTQMTTKFEGERDARIAVASKLADESALVKQLRSDLEKQQSNLHDEKVNSKKLVAEREDMASALEKAREEQKLAASNLDALKQSTKATTDKLEATIKDKNGEIKALKAKRTQIHKDLVSERQKCSRLEDHSIEVKRRLIAFHFGANILTTYLLMMLREDNARCIPMEREAVDDEHDLWDVQAALKRLVDGCTSFVESIPDRQDFYHYAECPLCIPETSPATTPSKKVFVRIKKEPKDVRLSGPSHCVAF